MKIIITGVTRGLGRALTEEFIRLGHTVIGCGRGSEGIFDLRMKHGAPHSFDVVDVSSATKVGMWGARALAFGETPDLLINNAALMNTPAPLWKVPAEEFEKLVNVNHGRGECHSRIRAGNGGGEKRSDRESQLRLGSRGVARGRAVLCEQVGDRRAHQVAGRGVARRHGGGAAQPRGDRHRHAPFMLGRRRGQLSEGGGVGEGGGAVGPA
jgi:NAD(P)-dependent dehydrogenase (short-subunit alcohol dehydrogenase family)